MLPKEQQDRRVFLYGAGMEYRTSRTTNAYANYSRAFRSGTVLGTHALGHHRCDRSELEGRDRLQSGWGLPGRAIAQHLSFDVGGFLLHYNDRIGTIQQDGVAHKTNVGAMVSRGVEAYVQFEPWRMVVKEPRFGKTGACSWRRSGVHDGYYSQWNDPARRRRYVNDGNRVENAPRTIERYGANYLYKGFSASVQWSRVGDVYTDALNTEDPECREHHRDASCIPSGGCVRRLPLQQRTGTTRRREQPRGYELRNASIGRLSGPRSCAGQWAHGIPHDRCTFLVVFRMTLV